MREFICAAGLCALIAPVADALTVSVPEKSHSADGPVSFLGVLADRSSNT